MTCACLLTFTVSPSESPRAPRSTLRPVFDCSSSRKLGAALNERFRPRGRRPFGPAGADEAPPRAAASALEVEVRVRVLVALDDRFAGEGMQLVLARPQLDPTDLARDRLRQLGELEAADAFVRCEVLPAVGEDRPCRLGIGG